MAGEVENAATGGTAKADDTKDGAGEHAHTMLIEKFQDFNTGAEDHFFFSQVSEEKFSNLPPSWLLLNSESTIYIIANKAMVSNIKISSSLITLHCNSGPQQVEYTNELNGYRRVWYDPKAITNILSLYRTTRKYRVVFNSKASNCFRMMLPWREVVFNVSTNGLYYHDTVDRAIVLVKTVTENNEGFTLREYEGAKAARRALGLVGYPSERDSTNMVSSNMIVNFPVTPRDIKNANKIFGPNAPFMKGKSVRRLPEAVVSNYFEIPEEILSMNVGLEVSVDIMFIDNLAFLVSVINQLKFTMIE